MREKNGDEIMILDEISYTSEYGLIQAPVYPEVYHIELTNLAERISCPYCTGKLNKRMETSDYP